MIKLRLACYLIILCLFGCGSRISTNENGNTMVDDIKEHSISNGKLIAKILKRGAELSSLKKGNEEYIWQADPAHWNRHSPILFPIVGKLKDNEMSIDGKTYKMKQHGFARDYDFVVKTKSENSITFQQKANDNTLNRYPYNYILEITYTLNNLKLNIEYVVINPMNETMYFSLGAHPAFNCPFDLDHKRNEYALRFDKKLSPKNKKKNKGLYIEEYSDVFTESGLLKISDSLFNNGSLTFNPNPFEKVTFVHLPSNKEYLSVEFKNFPFLGIWAPDAEAPFVCIEPWHGISDNLDHNKIYKEKEGVMDLSPKESFSCSYSIEIFN